MAMNVVDLCLPQNYSYWPKFLELLSEAQTGGDRNAKNYIGLDDKVPQHDAFHLLLDDESPIAFAGLYNGNIYPSTISRAMNRAYYAKAVRQSGLPTNKEGRHAGGLIARHILPEQVAHAKKIRRSAIFFSVEFNRRKRTIKALSKWINKYDSTGTEKWTALDGMYFTCPRYPDCIADGTCWQNISMLSFVDGFEFPLERIERDEWFKRFAVSG